MMSAGWPLLVLGLIAIVPLVLMVIALIGIANTPTRDTTAKVIWIVVVIVFPFVGSIVWLVMGRRSLEGRTGPV